MKKVLSVFGYIIYLSGQLSAQVINTTFYGSSIPYSDGLTGRKVAPQYPDGDLVVFSSEVNYPPVPLPSGLPLFMLNQTDANGNWLRSISTDYGFTVHHIIPTRRNNGGTLLAGVNTSTIYQVNGIDYNKLWVINFDDGLNTVWSKSMYIRAHTVGHDGIDIERIDGYDGDGGDLFFIAFSEGSHVPGMEHETDFSVLSIRENGTQMWYKSYGDYTRDTSMPLRNNELYSITKPYVDPVTNNTVFTIAGAAQMGPDYKLFYSTIDAATGGQIISYGLMNFSHSKWDVKPDVIWDADRELLVSTWETTPAGPANPNIITTIGLMTLDRDFSFSQGVYYDIGSWFGANNSGKTITYNPQFNSNYVLGAYLSGPLAPNYKIFEINANTLWLTPLGGRVFNMYTPASFDKAFHALDMNNHYYFVQNVLPNLQYSGISPRLIKTSPVVPTCGVDILGMEPTTFRADKSNIDLGENNPVYVEEDDFPFTDQELRQDYCDNAPDPNNYLQAPNVNISRGKAIAAYEITDVESMFFSNTKADVNPTLLHTSDILNCKIHNTDGKFTQIKISNSSGQIIYNSKHILNKGETHISIPVNLSIGMHIVYLAVDGKVIKTQKISVIE